MHKNTVYLLPLFSEFFIKLQSSSKILQHVVMSPHPSWTALTSHASPCKCQNVPPNIPSPCKLISLLCFLTCYTFFHISNWDELYDLLILLSRNYLENLQTVHLYYPDRLNGISSRTSFVNLHHYRSLKLTSRHISSRFIKTRLSAVTRFCARCSLFRCAITTW